MKLSRFPVTHKMVVKLIHLSDSNHPMEYKNTFSKKCLRAKALNDFSGWINTTGTGACEFGCDSLFCTANLNST